MDQHNSLSAGSRIIVPVGPSTGMLTPSLPSRVPKPSVLSDSVCNSSRKEGVLEKSRVFLLNDSSTSSVKYLGYFVQGKRKTEEGSDLHFSVVRFPALFVEML
jgi:hypothetical protein